MSTDEVLAGIGLVLALAVGSQLVARRLRVPAIVVLLPAGFLAGALTDVVDPNELLGQLYQPFVAIAVGLILFEAGMRLSASEADRDVRRPLWLLVAVGVVLTFALVTVACGLLFPDLPGEVPLLIGAILVVSGPTVVMPLLAFIRPARRVRSLLKFEGVLIDPVGAMLGVLTFEVVSTTGGGAHPGEFFSSIGIGLVVGAAAALVLWLLLTDVHHHAPRMVVPVTLATVVGAVVVADLIHDDSGLAAATLMGILVGNQARLLPPARRIDVAYTSQYWEATVQLLVGVLFVLVSASVSPSAVEGVLPGALVLVAVMVLVIRPLVVLAALWRSRFTVRERAFIGWLAPRGIVAGATAASFGPQLAAEGVAGAEDVLPIVFVAIFGTVVVYGLTAPLVAGLLGVRGAPAGAVLIVGGNRVAREVATALAAAGAPVRLWTASAEERDLARAGGLAADQGQLIVDAESREEELEDVGTVVLLTPSDDFNATAAAGLRAELGHAHVVRVAPVPHTSHLLPPASERGVLGGPRLTLPALDRALAGGARVAARPALPGGAAGEGAPLFVVSRGGRVRAVADDAPSQAAPGDTVVALTGGPPA